MNNLNEKKIISETMEATFNYESKFEFCKNVYYKLILILIKIEIVKEAREVRELKVKKKLKIKKKIIIMIMD